MSRNEGKISKNEFNPTLKTEYETTVNNSLNAKVTIGNGTLNTNNKTIIPAINELMSISATLNNSIGTLSTLKTTAKGSAVDAINELFQSSVDLQNIAKSALNAAGISYSNDQLKTLVSTMGNNLFTKAMKDQLSKAITDAGGSPGNGTITDIINGISNIKGQIKSQSLQYDAAYTFHQSGPMGASWDYNYGWTKDINLNDLIPNYSRVKALCLYYQQIYEPDDWCQTSWHTALYVDLGFRCFYGYNDSANDSAYATRLQIRDTKPANFFPTVITLGRGAHGDDLPGTEDGDPLTQKVNLQYSAIIV